MQAPTLSIPGATAQPTPIPQQNLQPAPLAFGSNVAAQGLGELGAVATQHGNEELDYAKTVQGLNNKQAADSAYVSTSTDMNNFVEDYQAKNRGMAAYDNSGAAFAKLAALRDKGEAGLSPLALVEYQANSRRALQYAQSTVRSFANSQRYTSLVATNKATIATAQGQALASDDPEVLSNSIATIAQTNAAQANIQGWEPAEAQQNLHNDVGAVFLGKLKVAVDGGDQLKAQSILRDHVDDMTAPQIEQAESLVNRGHVNFQAQMDRQNALSGQPLVSAPAPPSSVLNAIIGEESGGNDNTASSLKGAVGPAQITPATFAQFAKAGEDINNPADNRKVAARIVNSYMAKYNGDAARTAVAYFSGPGNVAPAGAAQPYIHDYSDGNERVSQYVAHVTAKVGGGQPAQVGGFPQISSYTDPNAYLTDARTAAQAIVDAKYAGRPDQATASYNALVSGATQQADILRTSQESAYVKGADMVQSGNLEDISTIPVSLLNQMSPTQRLALERDASSNANRYTPEKMENYTVLHGMSLPGGDQQRFANEDLAKWDITPAERKAFINQQQAIRQGKTFKINTVTDQAVNSKPAQQALHDLGVVTPSGAIDHNSKNYFQFYGALADKIDQWSGANPNKVPDQKTLNGFISQVTAGVGYKPPTKSGLPFGIGDHPAVPGTPAFDVPDDYRQAVVNSFAKRGLKASEQDVHRYYRLDPHAKF